MGLLAFIFLAIVFENILDVSAPRIGSMFSGKSSRTPAVKRSSFEICIDIDTSIKPTSDVVVSGRGVYDTFELSRKNKVKGDTKIKIATDKYALYQNDKYGVAFFTDTDSTLVVLKEGECTKRSYTALGSKATYTEAEMSLSECEEVKRKMEEAKDTWKREHEEKDKNKSR